MLSKVIERLKNREAIPVYRRVREKGRMTPEGLNYVQSWVEPTLTAAFNRWSVSTRRFWRNGPLAGRILSLSRCAVSRGGGGISRPATLYQPPRMCCARRSRVINAASLGRSCSVRAVNFNPKPVPARAWRTTASARI